MWKADAACCPFTAMWDIFLTVTLIISLLCLFAVLTFSFLWGPDSDYLPGGHETMKAKRMKKKGRGQKQSDLSLQGNSSCYILMKPVSVTYSLVSPQWTIERPESGRGSRPLPFRGGSGRAKSKGRQQRGRVMWASGQRELCQGGCIGGEQWDCCVW